MYLNGIVQWVLLEHLCLVVIWGILLKILEKKKEIKMVPVFNKYCIILSGISKNGPWIESGGT